MQMGSITRKELETKSGCKFIIRPICAKDAQKVIDLEVEVASQIEFHISPPEEFKISVEKKENEIRERLEDRTSLYMVAIIDSEIVAVLDARCHKQLRIKHVVWFAVNILKDFQNDGIGSAMMREFIAWAKTVDQIEKIGLHTHSTNNRAIGMYSKLGFIEDGRRIHDIKYDDYYADTVTMGMIL